MTKSRSNTVESTVTNMEFQMCIRDRSQTEMMLGKAAFITNGTWMENEMQDAPREDGFEFAMAPIPTENADDVHYVFDSCEQFSIPAAAKNPELAKEFLRFLYSDESVSALSLIHI